MAHQISLSFPTPKTQLLTAGAHLAIAEGDRIDAADALADAHADVHAGDRADAPANAHAEVPAHAVAVAVAVAVEIVDDLLGADARRAPSADVLDEMRDDHGRHLATGELVSAPTIAGDPPYAGKMTREILASHRLTERVPPRASPRGEQPLTRTRARPRANPRTQTRGRPKRATPKVLSRYTNRTYAQGKNTHSRATLDTNHSGIQIISIYLITQRTRIISARIPRNTSLKTVNPEPIIKNRSVLALVPLLISLSSVNPTPTLQKQAAKDKNRADNERRRKLNIARKAANRAKHNPKSANPSESAATAE